MSTPSRLFANKAAELFPPGDETIWNQTPAPLPPAGTFWAALEARALGAEKIRSRYYLHLGTQSVHDGRAEVQAVVSLTRQFPALEVGKNYPDPRATGQSAMHFSLEAEVTYPVLYGNQYDHLRMRRTLAVSHQDTLDTCSIIVPALDRVIALAQPLEQTEAFLHNIVEAGLAVSAIARGLEGQDRWPQILAEDIESWAVIPTMPDEPPSLYDESRRMALNIAYGVTTSGFTLTQ